MNNASPETRQQRRWKQRHEKRQPFAPQKNAFKRAMAAFKERAEVLKAAASMLPIDAKLAFMALAQRIGDYRSRGHGLNKPSYAHGAGSRGGSWPKAHYNGQECLRRAVGGWAFAKRCTGMTKHEILAAVQRRFGAQVRLEKAIEFVRNDLAAA